MSAARKLAEPAPRALEKHRHNRNQRPPAWVAGQLESSNRAAQIDRRTIPFRKRRIGHHAIAALDATTPGGRIWHARRAESLGRGLFPRVTACRTTSWLVRCSCGHAHEREAACGSRTSCKACSQAYWAQLHRRVIPAVEAAERAEWRLNHARDRGARRFARMLTLTVRHTGELDADLTTIRDGWARLRAWFAKQGIRKLRFVLVIEVTRGTDELGHVHAHVLAWLPFVPYDDASAEWTRATNGASTGLGKILPLRGGSHGAAVYVGSYATKGYQLDGDLAADWWSASFGRRAVSTSVGLFGPLARDCPGCGASDWTVERVERPTRWTPIAPVRGDGSNTRYPAAPS